MPRFAGQAKIMVGIKRLVGILEFSSFEAAIPNQEKRYAAPRSTREMK